MWLWSVHYRMLLPLLPPKRAESFHYGGPFHGRILSKLLQSESIPWATVHHKLLQCSIGSVPQEEAAPAQIPNSITSPTVKPAPRWALSPWVHKSLPGACSSMSSLQGQSLLVCASSMSCRAISATPAWQHLPILLH